MPIEFNDATLIESKGDYVKTAELMAEETTGDREWMLKSTVYVQKGMLFSAFVVHFWNNKRLVINEMFRPPALEIPNDDISELSKWATENGWDLPEPASRLMENPSMFNFWERQYQSGLIKCPAIEQREKGLMDRIFKAEEQEDDQEERIVH